MSNTLKNSNYIMKQSILIIIPAMLILCGCARWSNGQLQVKVHKPQGMENRPVRIYFNGALAYKTVDPTVTASLMPMKQTIRVEMEGAKPATQVIRIASGGKAQVVDFDLERN